MAPSSGPCACIRRAAAERMRGVEVDMKKRAVCVGTMVVSLLLVARAAPAQTPAQPGDPPVVRGTEMAGANAFRAQCEICHGKDPRAPSIATLRRMTAERIYQALTTGAMRTQAQAAKLTDKDLREIAAWMGGRKLEASQDDAKNMPNK